MSYLVLAYPELREDDFNLIRDSRRVHDSLYVDVVSHHFSFVYAVRNMDENRFVREVEEQAAGHPKIKFVLRSAAISKDGFEDSYHIFLIPDEGHGQMIRLHDALYSGLFKDQLRLDLDYIPHMAVGNYVDRLASKRVVDEWNQKAFEIAGTISRLSIVKYANKKVTLVKEVELA